MPRPKKCRRVCGLPKHPCFGPVGEKDVLPETVFMTVDEYETVRLIDLEGLTQEECSLRMNIARTTVQAIYIKARKKMADCLVNAKNLKIEGGDYRLCDGKTRFCNNKHCCRRCE